MDPNQPPARSSDAADPALLEPAAVETTTAASDSVAGPKSPPPTPVLSGIAPSRKPLFIALAAVVVALLAAGTAVIFAVRSRDAGPHPSTSFVVGTQDIKDTLPDVDISLKEVDVNITAVGTSLDDLQGAINE